MISSKKIKLLILDVDGTMTDAGVYIMENGMQFKKFNARDGMGIKLAINAGVEVAIISHSAKTTMVEERAKMLGMTRYYIGQEPKINILNDWIGQMGLTTDEVAYMGDDVNDLEIMKAVGLAICPMDAVPAIREVSDIILKRKGGDACVREFIDEYLLK